MFNLLADGTSTMPKWVTPVFIGVIVVMMLVWMFFSNRQRQKQANADMKRKDSLCPGTKIITIGGVIGEVVSVNAEENTFVLKTGDTEIKFDKRAIYQMTLPEEVEKRLAEEAALEKAKNKKGNAAAKEENIADAEIAAENKAEEQAEEKPEDKAE